MSNNLNNMRPSLKALKRDNGHELRPSTSWLLLSTLSSWSELILILMILINIHIVHTAPINNSGSSSSFHQSQSSSSSSDKSVLVSSTNNSSTIINNVTKIFAFSSSSSSSPSIPTLSFPPAHCVKDSDCIGKNTSSKIFYDPNGRCDIRQNLCVCKQYTGNDNKRYRRVQIKVNVKNSSGSNNSGSSSSSSSVNLSNNNNDNSANNNHHPSSNHQSTGTGTITVIYVSKCMLQEISTTSSGSNSNTNDYQQEMMSISMFRPHYYGQPCDDDRQCSANMICRHMIISGRNKINGTNNANGTSPTTATSMVTSSSSSLAQMLIANRTKRCRCPMGQHWNKYIRRCEWNGHHSSQTLFQFGDHHHSLHHLHHGLNADGSISGNHGASGNDHHYYYGGIPIPHLISPNGQSGGSSSFGNGFSGGSHGLHHQMSNTTSNIDLKIFEIVLEIAFLVACLLGYKVCSSFCFKEQDQDKQHDGDYGSNGYGSGDEHITGNHHGSAGGRKGDLKSDEESILSSSGVKSSSIGTQSTTSTTIGSGTGIKTNKQTSVPNLSSGISKNKSSTGSTATANSKYYKPVNSIKMVRKMSRKRRMSRFCARAYSNSLQQQRRNSSGSHAYGFGMGTGNSNSSLYYSNQNFRRLSSVSASAMSRSSSASTRNLLVKINPSDVNQHQKCLSISTILAPNGNGVTGITGDLSKSGSINGSRTPSPCYNCRIYKEVYSPSARCKSCRSSLLSVAVNNNHHDLLNDDLQEQQQQKNQDQSLIDFDSLMMMVGGGSSNANSQNANGNGSTDRLPQSPSSSVGSPSGGNSNKNSSILVLPPPYNKKPIRRSEEVGVPPHLRAPYRDSQPFWLK